jgi:UDP-GlcNAc3NAcA epimerase
MKVATIVGARPQFVKAAVVSRAIARSNRIISECLVHTGQHYDKNMSDLFFEQMEIPQPKYHLGIGGGTHGEMTGRMLEAIERVLLDETPDWVLIYGDTNSTLAGALAAAKLHIPVAHVEAGLRSYNRRMPEEINRVVSDHLATLLFAPTEKGVANLLREGAEAEKIRLVGDVMFDAALFYKEKARRESHIHEELGLTHKGYLLATIHRQENTDSEERLESILSGLQELHRQFPVILPLHPRTRGRIAELGLSTHSLHVIEPVGYLEMIQLIEGAAAVITDSGGVQKEAYFFKTPSLVLRDRTEWEELVEGGYAILTDADRHQIVDGLRIALNSSPDWNASFYGRGEAAESIVEALSIY